MPYLKPSRVPFNRRKSEISKRNGWRHAIFSPQSNHVRTCKNSYKGEWKNDKKEGKGTALYRGGWVYEGDWFNDQKHGYGVLSKVSKDGSIRKCYDGNWVAGKKHGFGSNWYEDGSYYEGTFKQNVREGWGCMWYYNGGYYEGTWKRNHFDGKGIFIQDSGNRYEGQFVMGEKEGHGTFYHLLSGQVQCGIWKNDVCIHGTMKDTYWRQSALHATPYPIPKIVLSDCRENYSSVCNPGDLMAVKNSMKAISTTSNRGIANIRLFSNKHVCF